MLSPEELLVADENAKKSRVACYVRCNNAEDAIYYLSHYGIFAYSFEMRASFYYSYYDGVVPMPQPGEAWAGYHSVLIIGYNPANKQFKFRNSWGTAYGKDGSGFFSCEYFGKYAMETVCGISERMFLANIKLDLSETLFHKDQELNLRLRFGEGFTRSHKFLMVIDLYKSDDILVGWIIASRIAGGSIEVIDFFVWPSERRKGYGTILLDILLDHEKIPNAKKIYGWLSLDDTRNNGWDNTVSYFINKGFEAIKDHDQFPWSPGQILLDLRD